MKLIRLRLEEVPLTLHYTHNLSQHRTEELSVNTFENKVNYVTYLKKVFRYCVVQFKGICYLKGWLTGFCLGLIVFMGCNVTC